MASGFNQGRRNFFRRNKPDALRPPWVNEQVDFTELCTRCDACIHACETSIISRGDGGFPEINFTKGECTFCQKCVTACEQPIFDLHQQQPWSITAAVQDNCLANHGVWCQSCKDACEPEAINFVYQLNQVPLPTIDTDKCTGCGACVEPCPTSAIKLR